MQGHPPQQSDTLLVTFEPDESRGFVRNAQALTQAPHSFRVEGVSVAGAKPTRVITVRGGRTCPCLGLWVVPKARVGCAHPSLHASLTEAQWASQPVSMPWRRWSNRNMVIVEYQFFAPRTAAATDWSTVARGTKHSFVVAGVAVSSVPDEVSTTTSGRIVGRWLVSAPLLEGYAVDATHRWLWMVLGLVAVIAIVLYYVRSR